MVCQVCDVKNRNDAKFCTYCGTSLDAPQHAATLPPRQRFALQPVLLKKRGRRTTCLLASAMLFALVLGCGGIVVVLSIEEQPAAAYAKTRGGERTDESATVDMHSDNIAEEGAERSGGEQQAVFIETIESFFEPYAEAENDLQRVIQRSERRKALAALLPLDWKAGKFGRSP